METVIQCLIQCLQDSCLSAVKLIWSNIAGRNSIKNYVIIFSATPNLQIIVDQLQSILGHDNDASKKQVAVWNELGHVPPYHSQDAAMVSWNIVSNITFILTSMLCPFEAVRQQKENGRRVFNKKLCKFYCNMWVAIGLLLEKNEKCGFRVKNKITWNLLHHLRLCTSWQHF